MLEPYPLDDGTRVLVGELNSVRFVASARIHAQQGKLGVVQQQFYDSHLGPCYEVLHEDDGTTAWYAHHELILEPTT
jgi:hypothetical protein